MRISLSKFKSNNGGNLVHISIHTTQNTNFVKSDCWSKCKIIIIALLAIFPHAQNTKSFGRRFYPISIIYTMMWAHYTTRDLQCNLDIVLIKNQFDSKERSVYRRVPSQYCNWFTLKALSFMHFDIRLKKVFFYNCYILHVLLTPLLGF